MFLKRSRNIAIKFRFASNVFDVAKQTNIPVRQISDVSQTMFERLAGPSLCEWPQIHSLIIILDYNQHQS